MKNLIEDLIQILTKFLKIQQSVNFFPLLLYEY